MLIRKNIPNQVLNFEKKRVYLEKKSKKQRPLQWLTSDYPLGKPATV
jgi:hypothetical protein